MSWVYRPDHPQANKNGMVDRDLAGPRTTTQKSIYIMSDLPGYKSVASGKWVDGRRDRREDLKRAGCREVDPSEGPKACRTKKWAERLRMDHDPQYKYSNGTGEAPVTDPAPFIRELANR